MVWCKDGGEVDVEGCGRLSAHDGQSGNCVVLCVQVGWFVGGGNECKFCEGGWCKCECVGETEGFVRKLSESCHQHALHQVATYVWRWRNVTGTCSCDSRRLTRGLGWWGDEISCFVSHTRFHEIPWCDFSMRLTYEISFEISIFSYETSCTLTVHVIDFLFLRQCFIWLRKLVYHRFVAIRGTGVQHRLSLRLCQLAFAHVLLEHIVHRARWLRQLLSHALQGLTAQKDQQLLHRAP